MKAAALTGRYATKLGRLTFATESSGTDLLGNVFACLIPMLMFMEVDVGGRLFLSEILLLCMLPFLLVLRGRLLLAPLPKKLLLLGVAWLLSQILTDAVRETPFEDWSRGWSKIAFLLINFSAIYIYLNGNIKRFISFALGVALGQILTYFFDPNIYAEDYHWKFGYGAAITLIVVLASQSRIFAKKKIWSTAIIMGVGVLNFYMDFRSLGLICLLTGMFAFIRQLNRFNLKKMKPINLAMLILLGGASIYGIAAFYEFGASEGWFGEDAHEKYLIQSSGDAGILVGGRTEILASVQAISDSPIIGHGSWAKDVKYVQIMLENLRQHGYALQGEIENELIPSHSYILGAWVESGVVGAVFWIWAFMLSVRALTSNHGTNSYHSPLITFIAFYLLWNIPFSPLGAEGRLYTAYDLSLMMLALTTSSSFQSVKGNV